MGCPIFKNKFKDEKDKQQKKKKVILCGLEGAGKTTILNQLKSGSFTIPDATIGLNIESITLFDTEILIFDVGGKVPQLWSHYYDNLDAMIFVVDCNQSQKLMRVREQLIQINDDLQYRSVPILILFNKIDLAAQADYNAIVDESGIYDVMDQDALIQKCSAKTGEGLLEGFKKLFNFLDNTQKQSQFIDNDAMSDSKSFHLHSLIK